MDIDGTPENPLNFRVLSIQSHVVSGYVGNKSACFPMQLLGLDVDVINSVQFSNHTGYGNWCGEVLKSEQLEDLYKGLKMNRLVNYDYILTGYVGDIDFLTKLLEMISELKKDNPNIFFVCDPVMGDNGSLYVPAGVLPVYKKLIPLSDLITPNQFEVELLTGIKIETKMDVPKAMDIFHNQGVKTVVLSSVEIKESENLFLFGSSILNGQKSAFSLEIPKISGTFVGSGDLFAALLLSWMAKSKGDLKLSCEKSSNTMRKVLCRTLEYASRESDPTSPKSMELKIVQSKTDIENPPSDLKCVLN